MAPMNITPIPTPAPMPALAPVERPEGASEDPDVSDTESVGADVALVLASVSVEVVEGMVVESALVVEVGSSLNSVPVTKY